MIKLKNQTMSNRPYYSNPSIRVIVRMMKIIEDIYKEKKNTNRFNGEYLKKNKEQLWFLSFLRKMGMIDNNNVWTGPDIKELNKNNKYFRFITLLYENRVHYSKFEAQEESPEEQEISEQEIPGFISSEDSIMEKEEKTKCISIPGVGMYFLEIGPNKTRYIVNVNKEASSIWQAE